MIIKCNNRDIDKIFEYIGEDYGKCLYIFIDLKKYGLDDENFNVWIQQESNNEICAIISEYYGGVQIYSKNQDFIVNEIVNFITKRNTNVIFSIKENIDKLKFFLPNYKQETGTVSELFELKFPPNNKAYEASVDEIEEIVRIIAEDENIGKPYGFESLYNQFIKRKKDNFGRNYILRDELTNNIICHAGTYAELEELAIIGGVMTSIPYRGKGFSKETLSSLCNQLKSENKRIFSFFYIPSAEKMHYGVGFEKIGDWSKLSKT